MQVTNKEHEQVPHAPEDSKNQTVSPIPVAQVDESDDDPDVIFSKAVAEIDTQPLLRRKVIVRWHDVFQTIFCVSLMGVSLFGIVWQVLTYPHTLVILYAVEKPARITVPLAIPTRMVAPVTVTRSQTTSTSGHGHLNATAATGTLIFYNGSSTPQDIPIGSVFTGNDGVKVTTDQSATIPAANLPAIGSMPVLAHAMFPGSQGNIAAFDIIIALSPVLKVRNEAPFNNGRDARTYRAVAAQDLTTLTSTVNETVTQAFTTAFLLQQGEQAIPTQCHSTTTANHAVNDESVSVTVTTIKVCSALAYNRPEVDRLATAAFTRMKPGVGYHIIGNVQTTLQSVSPFTVTLNGTWVYTFSTEYEQDLAQHIQGDTPTQARKYLLKTGVISQASVPSTLPASMYIEFVVLAG